MSKSVKITPIIENQSKHPHCLAEHGLSLLINYDDNCLLFDTGASDLLVKNADALSINLDQIKTVVLSHGHFDHTGGLEYLSDKKVFANPNVIAAKYFKEDNYYEYSGIPRGQDFYENQKKMVFFWVNESLQLTDRIKLHVNFPQQKNNEFFIKTTNGYISDTFTDELALSMNTANGLIIVTGCAHSGIINILEKIIRDCNTNKIYALLGGFHLSDLDDNKTEQIAQQLSNYNISKIGISHCTGQKLAKYLCPSQVFNFNVGDNFVG